MLLHRLFCKSRATIATGRRQAQFRLVAVAALACVPLMPSAMAQMNRVATKGSLLSF